MKIKVVRPIFTYVKTLDQEALMSQCIQAASQYGQEGHALSNIQHTTCYLDENPDSELVQVVADVEYDADEFTHFAEHIGCLLEIADRTLDIARCKEIVKEIKSKVAAYVEQHTEKPEV